MVSAIRSAIPNCASAFSLAQVLSLLQQALQLVVASQAVGGRGQNSQHANSPDSSSSPLGLATPEVMDTTHSPTSSRIPSPLSSVHEDMDTADCPKGLEPPAGPTVQELPTSSLQPTLPQLLSRPCTPVRRPRSSGGSQRRYMVDRRFIHRQGRPGGICSLEWVPKKKPHDLVRHAASTASEVVELIGQMLDTKGSLQAQKAELMRAISKVADIEAVYCPDSDASRPAGTQQQALDAWDCSAALKHIQSLSLLPKSLEVLVNFRIGQYLRFLSDDSNHATDVYAVIAHLCNEAEVDEVSCYHNLLVECGCAACLADSAWLSSDRQAERSRPCKKTEVMTKCLHDTFKALDPTALRHCAALAKSVPWGHPLLFAQDVSSTARVCQLLPDMQQSIQMAQGEGDRLPTLPEYLGQSAVFRVEPAEANKAVDYVDGDGGFLVVDCVPGLAQYLDS